MVDPRRHQCVRVLGFTSKCEPVKLAQRAHLNAKPPKEPLPEPTGGTTKTSRSIFGHDSLPPRLSKQSNSRPGSRLHSASKGK
jgi:hypothetical protein